MTRFSLRLVVLLLMFCLLAACESGPGKGKQDPPIRLDKVGQLPAHQGYESAPVLRVGVGAIISPQGTVQAYQPLLDYLGRKLDGRAVLMQRRTYLELNDLLARNVVDLGFICTGAYIEGARTGKFSLLVVPQINGKTTYRSFVIVPAASSVKEFADLSGKVFAFTDPLSTTGYFAPLSMLQAMGRQPESFFSRTIFTYNHDRSIVAVLEGLADGAAVDNLVYEFAVKRDPEIAGKIRVIHESRDFGIPPVVVPLTIAPAKKARLKELLMGLHLDPEGEKVLAALGVERFVEPEAKVYGP